MMFGPMSVRSLLWLMVKSLFIRPPKSAPPIELSHSEWLDGVRRKQMLKKAVDEIQRYISTSGDMADVYDEWVLVRNEIRTQLEVGHGKD